MRGGMHSSNGCQQAKCLCRRAATEKWKTIKGKLYYFKKNGAVAIGSYKIDGKDYVFSRKGQLLNSKGNEM